MRSPIILTLVMIAQVCYSQTEQKDSVVSISKIDAISCVEAFDELDSCKYYEARRDTAIMGLLLAIEERDSLISQKSADLSLLLSQKDILKQDISLCGDQLVLSKDNFSQLKKKKTKQLIGFTIGGISFGVGVGILATALILK